MAPRYIAYGWNRDGYVESRIEKRFGKIVWLFGIYPKIQGTSLYISIMIYLCLYTNMIWCMIILIRTTYLYLPNIIFISDCLSYFSINIMTMIISVLIVSRRSNMEETFIESENDFKYEDDIPYVDDDNGTEKWFQRGLYIGFLFISISFSAILFITPYLETNFGLQVPQPDGIDIHLLLVNWSPAPSSVVFRSFMIPLQVLDGTGIGCFAFGCSAFTLHFSMYLLKELRHLNWSISNLNKRARNHYNQMKNSLSNKSWSYEASMGHCLKQNIKHFVAIKKFTAIYVDWMDRHMFLVTLLLSLSIGFALVAIASGESINHPGKALAATCQLIVQAYLISFINMPGQLIMDESGKLIESVYCVNWYDYDERTKKTINIMQAMFLEPIQLQIGKGLAKINYEALQMVFNSAYSFLNLLMAFQTR